MLYFLDNFKDAALIPIKMKGIQNQIAFGKCRTKIIIIDLDEIRHI